MAYYRCYFLDARQHFTDVTEIQSIDDQAALQQARAAFATYAQYSGFELWENQRMVHFEMANRRRDVRHDPDPDRRGVCR